MRLSEMNIKSIDNDDDRFYLFGKIMPLPFDELDKLSFLAIECDNRRYAILKNKYDIDLDFEIREVTSSKEIQSILDNELNIDDLALVLVK